MQVALLGKKTQTSLMIELYINSSINKQYVEEVQNGKRLNYFVNDIAKCF